MPKASLVCHSDTIDTAVQFLQVEVERLPESDLRLNYVLNADLTQLRIPAPRPAVAVDGLWEHMCFEVFIAAEGEAAYYEYNFSPSGEWAAYGFSTYRLRSDWTAGSAPQIAVRQQHGQLQLQAVIAAADLPPSARHGALQLGLTAVLEANDGSRSYWALQHPSAKPDFHQRAGFVLALN